MKSREEIRTKFLTLFKEYPSLWNDKPLSPIAQLISEDLGIQSISGSETSMETWPAYRIMENCIEIGLAIGKDTDKWLEWRKQMSILADELDAIDKEMRTK